ncbi:MAG: response regulator [Acetobacterales bacterium]
MKHYDLTDLRVLIVDDDGESRALMRDYLADLGVGKVYQARSGAEPLQFLKSASVELVISDIRMAPMSGDTFVRRLRDDSANANRSVPVMMATEEPDRMSIEAAKRAGVTSLMAKASDFDEFRQHVIGTLKRAGIALDVEEPDGISAVGPADVPTGKAWE